MTKRRLERFSLPALFAGALLVAPLQAHAGDPRAADGWRYDASLYLWAAGLGGETASGRRAGGSGGSGGSSDIDVGFDTVIDNLNMAFMGAFQARNDRWSLLADVIYLNVGGSKKARVPVPLFPGSGRTIKVDGEVAAKAWLLNLIGGYKVWESSQGRLDALAGARYFDVKLDFGLGLTAGRLSSSVDLSPSVSVLDAVVGVKGHVDLNRQWYVPYYLDLGTGQSNFTWQALAGVGYRFHWGDLSLTYRHIDWQFGANKKIKNFNLSGPLLAATFHF